MRLLLTDPRHPRPAGDAPRLLKAPQELPLGQSTPLKPEEAQDGFDVSPPPPTRPSVLSRLWGSKVGRRVGASIAGTAILAVPVTAGAHALFETRLASTQSVGGDAFDAEEVEALHTQGVSQQEARAYEAAGVEDLDWILDLRQAQVTPEGVKAFVQAGVMDIDEMIDLAANRVDARLVSAFAQVGFADQDLVKWLVANGHSPETVGHYAKAEAADFDWDSSLALKEVPEATLNAYAKAGVPDLHSALVLHRNGIYPETFTAFSQLGITRAETIASLVSRHVSPAEAQAYQAAGVAFPEDMETFHRAGMSPEASQPYVVAGIQTYTAKKLFEAQVSAETSLAYQAAGVTNSDLMIDYHRLGLSPEEVAAFSQAGIQSSNALKELAAAGIDSATYLSYVNAGTQVDPYSVITLVQEKVSPETCQAFAAQGITSVSQVLSRVTQGVPPS